MVSVLICVSAVVLIVWQLICGRPRVSPRRGSNTVH